MRIVIALGGNALLERGEKPDAAIQHRHVRRGAQSLALLANAGVTKSVVALVTQTVVAANDPAFAAPTKFIGAGYPREQAEEAATRYGWTMALDGDR